MACSTVGLINLMDRALCPVITKVKVQYQSSMNFFRFFSTAWVVYSTVRIINFHFHKKNIVEILIKIIIYC